MFLGEADSVVADAEAFFAGTALEFYYVPGVVLGQTVDGCEDVHRDVLRDGAGIGTGFLGKNDPLQGAGALQALVRI